MILTSFVFFQDINTRLKNIINGAPCVLFMKGSPQEPQCGLCQHLYFCAVNNMSRGDREEWLGLLGIFKEKNGSSGKTK